MSKYELDHGVFNSQRRPAGARQRPVCFVDNSLYRTRIIKFVISAHTNRWQTITDSGQEKKGYDFQPFGNAARGTA